MQLCLTVTEVLIHLIKHFKEELSSILFLPSALQDNRCSYCQFDARTDKQKDSN